MLILIGKLLLGCLLPGIAALYVSRFAARCMKERTEEVYVDFLDFNSTLEYVGAVLTFTSLTFPFSVGSKEWVPTLGCLGVSTLMMMVFTAIKVRSVKTDQLHWRFGR